MEKVFKVLRVLTIFVWRNTGGGIMAALYDLKVRTEKTIEERKLGGVAIKGKIALQTGFLRPLIPQKCCCH